LEDEANLSQIPTVTWEVLSAIGYANERICERSYLQMIAFLEYFGMID
jgi:predicted deacylase